MYIGLIRLLKVSHPNVEYDSGDRLREEFICMDWGDDSKIEKAMTIDDDKDDDEEDFPEKNRQLKKEK